jgi:hypothetical protein
MGMMDSLSALAGLTSNVSNPKSTVQTYLDRRNRLDELKRNLALTGLSRDARGNVTSGFASGASPEDVTQLESDINDDPNLGVDAQDQVKRAQNRYEQDVRYSSPEATGQRKDVLAEALTKAEAPAKAAGAASLAVEQEKNRGDLERQNNQLDNTKKLLQTLTGGQGQAGAAQGGLAGPGGSIKPTVNASGGVSFTTTQMPALVQRARNQLLDAHSKTMEALQQAEKMYPGINDIVSQDEAKGPEGSTSFGSFLTGSGAPKYGSAMDFAGARAERAKYDWGIPTPFSELAQSASFGNIEQMAGQLPGVRGLATITPLFREHQSRWGHETPYQTARRLHGMAKMMEETIQTLDTSGASAEEGMK